MPNVGFFLSSLFLTEAVQFHSLCNHTCLIIDAIIQSTFHHTVRPYSHISPLQAIFIKHDNNLSFCSPLLLRHVQQSWPIPLLLGHDDCTPQSQFRSEARVETVACKYEYKMAPCQKRQLAPVFSSQFFGVSTRYEACKGNSQRKPTCRSLVSARGEPVV